MNQLAKITNKPAPEPNLPSLVLPLCPSLCESEWLLSRAPEVSPRLFSQLRFTRAQFQEQFFRDMFSWSKGREILLATRPSWRHSVCGTYQNFLEVLQPRVLWKLM